MAKPAAHEGHVAALVSASDIKQENPSADSSSLGSLPHLPENAPKRPFSELGAGPDRPRAGAGDAPQAKRVKTEVEPDVRHGSSEDRLALLVQDALSHVGSMVNQLNGLPDAASTPTAAEGMERQSSSTSQPPPARPAFTADPSNFIRSANTHALGSLALSMLLILVQPTLGETMQTIKNPETKHGRTYQNLQLSFQHVRRLYSEHPVLSTDDLGLQDDDADIFIELANLAQLSAWLVDGSLRALADADQHFLSIFHSQLSHLPNGMADLYLDIITQRAVESLATKEPHRPPEDLIGLAMTQGLEERLRSQHGGDDLTGADQDFVSRVQARKARLEGEVRVQAEPPALRKKYPLENLLRSLGKHVRGRLKDASLLADKLGLPLQLIDELADEPAEAELPPDGAGVKGEITIDDDLSSFFEKTASGLVHNAMIGLAADAAAEPSAATAATSSSPPHPPPSSSSLPPSQSHEAQRKQQQADDGSKTASGDGDTDGGPPKPNGKIDLATDYKELEALVAESTSNYVKTTLHGLSPTPYQPTVPQSTAESMAAQLAATTETPPQGHFSSGASYSPMPHPSPSEPEGQPTTGSGDDLPPNQTFPSAILYDKARQAALSKSSTHTRREGIHSTRRPWSQEEEKALMAGLDMVKGPHWSQILTLFGQNGTMSEILKDRTQVQLKDKARNLKLFFLKTNSEMPYYLQAVTGELKTRAPTQAARKEAEERARLNSEEDQAKLQGIMTLAGGLQHPPTPGGQASAASPASTSSAKLGAGAGPKSPAGAVSPLSSASAAGTPRSKTSTTPSLAAAAARTGVLATTQQVLQALPQPPLRPHAQLPLQAAARAQAANGPLRPSLHPQPPLGAAVRAAAPPSTQPLAGPAPRATAAPVSPATTAATATATTTTSTTTPPQRRQPASPPPAPASSAPSSMETPRLREPTTAARADDNAAEAAVLEGLQAAVAQSST